MKPKGFAKHDQTLSSKVGSGDETKKHIVLDHVELFHLIVWKLYHVIEYAKGFHTDDSPLLNRTLNLQHFQSIAAFFFNQQIHSICARVLVPLHPFYLQVNIVLSLCRRCESIHCMHYKANTLNSIQQAHLYTTLVPTQEPGYESTYTQG